MEIGIPGKWSVLTGAHGGRDFEHSALTRGNRKTDDTKIICIAIEAWPEPDGTRRIYGLATVGHKGGSSGIAINRCGDARQAVPMFPNAAAAVRLGPMIGQQTEGTVQSRFPAVTPRPCGIRNGQEV